MPYTGCPRSIRNVGEKKNEIRSAKRRCWQRECGRFCGSAQNFVGPFGFDDEGSFGEARNN